MIYVLEPYLTSSHKHWLKIFSIQNKLEVKSFTLPGYHWKWRMHGAAITLAKKLSKHSEPDHILVSEMCDVAVLKALIPAEWNSKITVYFHENQLTFPWSPKDIDLKLQRNNHYAFINYTSALAADYVVFNSNFHFHEFVNALPKFLHQFPEKKDLSFLSEIKTKASVIPIHLFFPESNSKKWLNTTPRILWNHRWEYDKNPELFFQTLFKLKKQGLKFELVVLGKKGEAYPHVFKEAKEKLASELVHFGFEENFETYISLISSAHLIPVTSIQDFFGISALEAAAIGAYPLLPNRLAFPEHFNSKEHLYETDSELENMLEFYLKNWEAEKKSLGEKSTKLKAELKEKYSVERVISLWHSHFKNAN